jgi:predicted nucleic acid-binding protein
MSWCYPEEHDRYAQAVLDVVAEAAVFVPSLWPIEVTNALLIGERRHRLSTADVARFLELLRGLSIQIDTQTGSRAFGDTLALARTYGLTAYDAAYLELALRENLELATLDDQLKKAAKGAGATVFG